MRANMKMTIQVYCECGEHKNGDKEYCFGYGTSGDYLTLKDALTPPTADEVCEELRTYLKKPCIYVKDVKKFAFEGFDGWEEIAFYGLPVEGGQRVRFSLALPPHLVSLIGRFYEGLNNKG